MELNPLVIHSFIEVEAASVSVLLPSLDALEGAAAYILVLSSSSPHDPSNPPQMKPKRQSPKPPLWILRFHSPSPVHSVSLGSKHGLISCGDAQGRVSLTSISDYRPRFFWKAHNESILSAEIKDRFIITHGRDNSIKVWRVSPSDSGSLSQKAPPTTGGELPSRMVENLPLPELVKTLEVNSLNYCRFSFYPLPAEGERSNLKGLIAVPNTLDAAFIDIYNIFSGRRLCEAIGKPSTPLAKRERPAILMSLKLFTFQDRSELACLAAYEDGSLTLWSSDSSPHDLLTQARAFSWKVLWSEKRHSEAVMAVDLSPKAEFAISVSADDRLVRYSLDYPRDEKPPVPLSRAVGHPGKASVAIRSDSKLIAVGGWDGNVRLYSTLDLKNAGSLKYHRGSVLSVCFGGGDDDGGAASGKEDEEGEFESSGSDTSDSDHGRTDHSGTMLACGSEDGKVSLWRL
ncbi:WD40 repeat-like protein [Violaceomyces palustris]|uniref:WD40 repeat-like protein n=1 Tax=Violaceomyces palustris TaxID=1673888 RepID=A0ACD0P066_9BASI|nr:WD40 repeat-like protein [Violaceomyces palustris]